jgi:sulfatase modifying factor 1
MTYQLPTEAQWEYACRAGTTTAYAFSDYLTRYQANYNWDGSWNTGNDDNKPVNVGQYGANQWGFHDMHGNVYEWCADWYGDYPTGAVSDPVGPAVGSYCVYRGGSYRVTARTARSAFRNWSGRSGSADHLGFRLSLRPASK